MQKTIARMTGYKATDKNMRCNGYRFELGKWSEPVAGDLGEYNNGYHFCENMSGVWSYYPLPCEGTRVFKVEAEEVLEKSPEPGADVKRVCRRLRLVEEVTGFDDRGNRGEWNTGSGNTGDGNTGSGNTGNWNSGNRNTGRRNIGYCNTGNDNTGDGNTGSYNTGFGNTGDRNTGSGNACSNSSGFFGWKEPTVTFFNKDTGLTHAEVMQRFSPLIIKLAAKLASGVRPQFSDFKTLPNITPSALRELWKRHQARRS